MRKDRAIWVGLGTLALAGAAWLLYRNGPSGVPWLPDCVFHRLSGLHCPGCGMTRAASAFLHGNPVAAFRFNPVGVVLLPLAMLGLGIEMIGWIREKPLAWRLRPGRRAGWTIVGILIAFWILRNVPWWPFTLLAPPVVSI
jgi:hypothetical protein